MGPIKDSARCESPLPVTWGRAVVSKRPGGMAEPGLVRVPTKRRHTLRSDRRIREFGSPSPPSYFLASESVMGP